MSEKTEHLAVYTTPDRRTVIEERQADSEYTSLSAFLDSYSELGWKTAQGFDATVVRPDETLHEVRKQRNQLKDEIDNARTRIEELEEQAFYGERSEVRRYIHDNPGSSHEELIKHMQDTVPERLDRYIDAIDDICLDEGPDGGHGWWPK